MDTQLDGQQQLFYTEEEVQAKITQVVENLTSTNTANLKWELSRQRRRTQESAYDACKNMLGEVDDESMVSIYNTIAEACGWDTIEAFTKMFSVTVMYNGSEIAIFEDVEAQDEDEACNTVLENMQVESANISFDISYGHATESGSADVDTYSLDTDEFTAEATEQE